MRYIQVKYKVAYIKFQLECDHRNRWHFILLSQLIAVKHSIEIFVLTYILFQSILRSIIWVLLSVGILYTLLSIRNIFYFHHNQMFSSVIHFFTSGLLYRISLYVRLTSTKVTIHLSRCMKFRGNSCVFVTYP